MIEIIKEACRQLEKNRQDWETRYKGYIENITAAEKKYAKPEIRLPKNLRRYKSISSVGKQGYDVRYAGQSIGEVKLKKGEIWFQAKEMSRKFGFSKETSKLNKWNSVEASNFRSYFEDCENEDLASSNERYIEQLLLNDMAKSKSGPFINIKPVTLLGAYFQMPTPFGASEATPHYAEDKGGGIDILARVGRRKGVKLCVIELKDEYTEREPQSHAMKQAAIYATFIAYLLRSDMADKWWKAFGFNKAIPKSLVIPVLTLMPLPTEKPEGEIIGSFTVNGLDNVTLDCHSIYYEKLDGNKFRLTSDNYTDIIRKQ